MRLLHCCYLCQQKTPAVSLEHVHHISNIRLTESVQDEDQVLAESPVLPRVSFENSQNEIIWLAVCWAFWMVMVVMMRVLAGIMSFRVMMSIGRSRVAVLSG